MLPPMMILLTTGIASIRRGDSVVGAIACLASPICGVFVHAIKVDSIMITANVRLWYGLSFNSILSIRNLYAKKASHVNARPTVAEQAVWNFNGKFLS